MASYSGNIEIELIFKPFCGVYDRIRISSICAGLDILTNKNTTFGNSTTLNFLPLAYSFFCLFKTRASPTSINHCVVSVHKWKQLVCLQLETHAC